MPPPSWMITAYFSPACPSLFAQVFIVLSVKWKTCHWWKTEQLCPQNTSTVPNSSLLQLLPVASRWRHRNAVWIWPCQKYMDTSFPSRLLVWTAASLQLCAHGLFLFWLDNTLSCADPWPWHDVTWNTQWCRPVANPCSRFNIWLKEWKQESDGCESRRLTNTTLSQNLNQSTL